MEAETISQRSAFTTFAQRSALVAATSLALVASAHAQQEFQYSGDDGPAHWAELDPAWEACGNSGSEARQSPIDLGGAQTDELLEPLQLTVFPTAIDMFNNGHTIEQRYEDTGSSIVFDGNEYALQQFHFHTLSEHTVGGEHDVMEMHAVFSNSDANLVVGTLFGMGWYINPFLQTLIDAGLPETNGDTTETDEAIDLLDALTDTTSYVTYEGSLTTPPCSETVTWIVLKEPATLSHEQFEAFRTILGNNFRPLQPLNERTLRATPRLAGR